MSKLFVLSLFVLACSAHPYGSLSKTSPVQQAPEPIAQVREPISQVQEPISQVRETYAPAPISYQPAPVQQSYAPIEAAVQTRRTYEVRPVLVDELQAQPQVIEISPNVESVVIHFRTSSSRLNVQQSHVPSAPAPVEHSSVQDHPHRLVHEVTKPVIQEVREIIQPYRRVTQEVRPVIEEIHTVVHKGERRAAARAPLPLKGAAPAYGAGALKGGAQAANTGYKAAKAA